MYSRCGLRGAGTATAVAVALAVGPATATAVEFESETTPTNSTPTDIEAADASRDGRVDLVIPDLFNQARYLEGRSNGTFAAPEPITQSVAGGGPELARFGPDRKPDLLLSDATNDELELFDGEGTGGFAFRQAVNVGDNPWDVDVADFDRDGNLDAAIVNQAGNSVSVVRSKRNGSLRAAQSYPVDAAGNPLEIALGRFDGNRRPDVVSADNGANQLSFFSTRPDGTLEDAVAVDDGEAIFPYVIESGKLAGEKELDLAVGNFGSQDVSVLEGDGSGGFTAGDPLAVGGEVVAVAVGDVNGDGRADIVAAEQTEETISVFVRKAAGFKPEQEFDVGENPAGIAIGNFDRRRDRDIAVASTSAVGGNGTLTVLLNEN